MTKTTRNITITIALTVLLVIWFFQSKKSGSGGTFLNPNVGNTPNDLKGRKVVFNTEGGKFTASTTPDNPNTGYMEVYLQIQNTTNSVQTVTLFDVTNTYNQQAINGSTYAYDLTAELANSAIYNNDSIVVIAQPNINSPFQPYTYTSGSAILTITEALAGLNALGIGTWTNPSGNLVQLTSSSYILSSLQITNIFTANADSADAYSATGSLIYSEGFQQNGVGTVTQIPLSNGFWNNPIPNTTAGAMNRNAVWNNASIPLVEYIGTSISVFMEQPGTVYIGVGFDNVGKFWVNGQLILNMDVNAMKTSIVAQYPYYSFVNPDEIPFYFWHIFPISLPAGYSSILVQNDNTGAQGAIAVEIYNNTAAQIAAATSYADLNILYRSANIVGQNLLF
jgi:hypothetical protein